MNMDVNVESHVSSPSARSEPLDMHGIWQIQSQTSSQSESRDTPSIWQIQTQTSSPRSTSSQQKRHRTSTEKVRTGCITCKRRHIKCDELKPHCTNCLKSRGFCEGYPAERKTKKPPAPAQVVWDSTQDVVPEPEPRKLLLRLDPDALDFRDDASMRYFGEFIELSRSPWVTAASNGDLWAKTMPQLAYGNQTLRYAAMAIGALSKWHSQTKSGSLGEVSVPRRPSEEGDTHYFHAVAYYCRSLKMQNHQASLPDAVLLSVLLLFFEALRGNRKAALDHVNHGLTLLLILTTDQSAQDHVVKFAPNPQPLVGSVADVFTNLAPQARAVLRGRFGQSPPPLPNLMKGLKDKNQTIESFMVLLSQLPRSAPSSDHIPVEFKSLDEYEQYWIPFQRKQTAIALIMQELIQVSKNASSSSSSSSPPSDSNSNSPNITTSNSTSTSNLNTFYHDLLGHPRIRDFCAHSQTLLTALSTAFTPLFTHITLTHPPTSPLYLRALHLRLQHLGMYIFEDPPSFLSLSLLEQRTPLFREYLSLASLALATARTLSTNPAHNLSLQCSMALYLLSIALHCRDPTVREQAIGLLKEYPGQDGLWNPRGVTAVAVRNRAVERGNVVGSGEREEQWQRLWRREFVFEDGGERAVFRYFAFVADNGRKGDGGGRVEGEGDGDGDGAGDGENGEWQLVEEAADLTTGVDVEDLVWKRQPLSGSGGPFVQDIYGF